MVSVIEGFQFHCSFGFKHSIVIRLTLMFYNLHCRRDKGTFELLESLGAETDESSKINKTVSCMLKCFKHCHSIYCTVTLQPRQVSIVDSAYILLLFYVYPPIGGVHMDSSNVFSPTRGHLSVCIQTCITHYKQFHWY